MSGQGEMTWADGSRFRGNFQQNSLVGKGRCYDKHNPNGVVCWMEDGELRG